MLRQHGMSKGDHTLQASTSQNIVKSSPQPMQAAQQNAIELPSSAAPKSAAERPSSANRSYRSDAAIRAPSGVPTTLRASAFSESGSDQGPRPAGFLQFRHKPMLRVAWADSSRDHASSSSSMSLSKDNASLLPTTLTGNLEADADIQAFYAARDRLLAARNRR